VVSTKSQTNIPLERTTGTSPNNPKTQTSSSQTTGTRKVNAGTNAIPIQVGVPVNVNALQNEIRNLQAFATQSAVNSSTLKEKIAILEANAKKKNLNAKKLRKNLNAARKEKEKLNASTQTTATATAPPPLQIPQTANTPLSSARSVASSKRSVNRNIKKWAARMPSPALSVPSPASPNVRDNLGKLVTNKNPFLLRSNSNPVTRGRLRTLVKLLTSNGLTYSSYEKRQKILDIYYELRGTKLTNKLTQSQLKLTPTNYQKLYNKIKVYTNSLFNQSSNRPSSATSSGASTFRDTLYKIPVLGPQLGGNPRKGEKRLIMKPV